MNKVVRIFLLASIAVMTPLSFLFINEIAHARDRSQVEGECTPYDLDIVKERFSAKIDWSTTGDCAGYVRFGITPNNTSSKVVVGPDEYLPVQEHNVTLNDLKPNTTYYLWVYSDGIAYVEDGRPIIIKM